MKNKFTNILLVMLGWCTISQAQIISVSPGADLTVLSGTIFTADGITLTPSIDYTINNTTLSRSATVPQTTTGVYISRVYQFSNLTAPYTGTVQISYLPVELNGIAEQNLRLNVYNGSAWQALANTTNDITNHYVLSTSLSGVPLSNLTLGDVATPLPVTWLSFTATAQSSNALLKWSTGNEQNTKSYVVQHSVSGTNWESIGSVSAAGQSSVASDYRYLDTHPATGNNYYRILQTDLDGKNSYSEVRSVVFDADHAAFLVVVNPVTDAIIRVKVYTTTDLSFYNAAGKLLWKKRFGAGLQNIAVTGYAKGTYYLSDQKVTRKVLIQ